AERDTEQVEQPASDCGPNDAEDDVHDKPHLTFHELLGEPASDPADDDGCDPAYLCVVHGYLLKYVVDDTKNGMTFELDHGAIPFLRSLIIGLPMSALGQKQTFAAQNGMSALPPIATLIAHFGVSAMGRFCCKSRKLQGYEFFAKTRNEKQSPIRIAS